MKTLTVRLPDNLAAEIEAESKRLRVSKSDIVRGRLLGVSPRPNDGTRALTMLELAGDLIGSVTGDGLPEDLSARKKHYLREWGYGKNRHHR